VSDFDMKKLQEPFAPEDIEWRVQRAGISASGNPWVMAVAYITNRAIQQRLDEVVGVENWQNEFKEVEGGFLCGLSIRIKGEWLTKWDGASSTKIEPIKGGVSDSMKRAAVEWGIGRYLYHLEVEFSPVCKVVNYQSEADYNVHAHKDKKTNQRILIDWKAPDLPRWAQPAPEDGGFFEMIEGSDSLDDLRKNFKTAVLFAKANQDRGLISDFVERKDKRKAQLESVLKSKSSQTFMEVQEWLTTQCENLKKLKSLQPCINLKNRIGEALAEKCEGQFFDSAPLIAQFEHQCGNHINSLKGENHGEN
jgi:hypothetical protein